MKALIQIFKVNDPRSGISKNGKPWTLQDAECALLNDDGTPEKVGVLNLPPDMVGDKAPNVGVYTASFTLNVEYSTRKIVAQLSGLVPVPVRQKPAAAA